MISMNEVSKFRKHYEEAVLKRPSLYTAGKTGINIVLPNGLLNYAEAAAGHSGYGAGARPVGIRRDVKDARAELARIFSSDEELARFILSSACDFDHEGLKNGTLVTRRVNTGKQKRTVKITLNNEEARKVFWTKQDKTSYDAMTAKYGKGCVDNDLMKLTWNEFDLRYGMDA